MNNIINRRVKFVHLGTIDYNEAWDYQTSIFEDTVNLKIQNRNAAPQNQKETPNYLLFCEHPHVYTLGKSGKPEHLLLNQAGLKKKDAAFYKINRGGDITYHGPGQIVGYPILDLDNFFTDIHKYLRLLEEAVIQTLQEYGLNSGRIEGLTGVWVDHQKQSNPRKICALGVKTSRWVTMHGFALNINTDLDYFNNIIPCGIEDKAVTSLSKELNGKVDITEVERILKNKFSLLFGMEIIEQQKNEKRY